ncbi:MAG TPA: hypothetical protein VEZ11_17100 [Thermoanaerobaculia bacterium]|nr:hypothetical protein [Thermoanaerobaculia bacterium]
MPNIELLGIVFVAILIIWVLLKMARVAIRAILLLLGLFLMAGALYVFFMR